MLDVMDMVRRAPQMLLNAVLPPRCPLCRALIVEHGRLCGDCWSQLKPIAEPMCTRCALPFAFESDSLLCGACLETQPDFDYACAPVLYDGKGRDLVLSLKHGHLFAAAPAMAGMMATRLRAAAGRQPEILVPVPLHSRRLLARRFNQSQLIAANLSRELGMSVNSQSLKKIKSTPSQGALNRRDRFENVRAAFEVRQQDGDLFAGKKILLVDDVLTTGATANACALALKDAGAVQVGVLAFARVGQPVSG